MMKKLCLLLALCLCFVLPAFAGQASAPARATANATIAVAETIHVTAPFSGTLKVFDTEAGQRVAEGEVLMEMDTVKIYAAQSGTVTALFAAPGDDADGIMARYGALAVIEPDGLLCIAADTATAYNSAANKLIHAGETLYLRHGSDRGVGRVTMVNGSGYTVEVLSGDFELYDSVACYRDGGYASSSKVGEGPVSRYPDYSVAGAGRVMDVHVQQGDHVQAGDLLFELADSSCAPGAGCAIVSPAEGAVSALMTSPGAQVYKGQLLCQISDLNALELRAEVDEVYIARLTVGSEVEFELDSRPGELLTGTVTEIRPLGIIRQNAAYYEARIALADDEGMLPGMNATVYID